MAIPQRAVSRGISEQFESDQIVVDLDDRDAVVRALQGFGLEVTELAADDRLGLALYGLADLAPALAPPVDVAALESHVRNRRKAPGEAEVSNLDKVLVRLRTALAPAEIKVGKNRYLHGIEGAPHIGGDGEPHDLGRPVVLPKREASGTPVRIGIMDTDISPDPELAGRYLAESEAILEHAEIPISLSAHALFGASIILGRAPAAELIFKPALDPFGRGETGRHLAGTASAVGGSVFEIARNMVRFLDYDIDVLHLPFGCVTDDFEEPFVLARALDRLDELGDIVVVASAGNHGKGNLDKDENPAPVYPAASPKVVAVGALAKDLVSTASFSPHAAWVDLEAPGEDQPGLFFDGWVAVMHHDEAGKLVSDHEGPVRFYGSASWEGTSFAAAHVTGAIAIIVAQAVPRVTAREAVDLLKQVSSHPSVIPAAINIRPYKF